MLREPPTFQSKRKVINLNAQWAVLNVPPMAPATPVKSHLPPLSFKFQPMSATLSVQRARSKVASAALTAMKSARPATVSDSVHLALRIKTRSLLTADV